MTLYYIFIIGSLIGYLYAIKKFPIQLHGNFLDLYIPFLISIHTLLGGTINVILFIFFRSLIFTLL